VSEELEHRRGADRAAVEDWIRAHVEPVGAIETAHERPWATALRVPLADGVAWFKACAPVQAFEPRLTAGLSARWPDRVAEVLGHDEERAWLLLADAGTPIGAFGNPPERRVKASAIGRSIVARAVLKRGPSSSSAGSRHDRRTRRGAGARRGPRGTRFAPDASLVAWSCTQVPDSWPG